MPFFGALLPGTLRFLLLVSYVCFSPAVSSHHTLAWFCSQPWIQAACCLQEVPALASLALSCPSFEDSRPEDSTAPLGVASACCRLWPSGGPDSAWDFSGTCKGPGQPCVASCCGENRAGSRLGEDERAGGSGSLSLCRCPSTVWPHEPGPASRSQAWRGPGLGLCSAVAVLTLF